MDPIDSGQGPEKPSEQCKDLTPTSRGRQRRKNPKYLDYETEDSTIVQSFEEKPTKKDSEGEKAATKKSPARRGRPKGASKRTADEENEATNKTPSESVEETAEEKPKKTGRGRKTPSKKTPAKKTPAKKTPSKNIPAKKTPAKKTPAAGADAEGGGEDAVKQENGTPKPKRKYVRKQRVQEVEPAPTHEKEAGDPQIEPEDDIEPGGRRRRGAAKAALKYLRNLAKEVFGDPSDQSDSGPRPNNEGADSGQKTPKGGKGRRGRKRKRLDSDAAEDEDFVPDIVEEEEEDEEDEGIEEEAADSDLESDFRSTGRAPAVYNISKINTSLYAKPINGLSINIMKNVWDATETTMKFREEHFTNWVFPEWLSSTSDWELVPQSDLEKYLPQEPQSAAFRVSREGMKKEETPLQRLSRFKSVPAHPERWDMMLFAGGPVWALEWCPTPDGATATQYVAMACHRGMDDLHCVNKTCTGPGLVQLWDVGKLEYDSRPDSQPALSYGLAQDNGFIWQLRWCPAGGWELPSSGRKAPFLPRLGLLAVATSNGVVTIYSLPHPEALNSSKQIANSENGSKNPPIYQAKGVVTLKLGSFKAPRNQMSGQVLSMDWVPEKPHNIIAIGFYDGVVGLWDLTTKSALLRLRESDGSMCLLPYRCLLAHDHAVRALAFCPASRHLLVTAGEDRYVKTWDLRRLYTPITIQKRYLTNEIYWPLNAPGLMMAQESAYVAKGSQGVHYFDHYMNSLLPIPRTSTLWSICYSDWLNSLVTADSLGEVIFSVLPQINYFTPYLKRTIERRFPIYLTSMVPCEAAGEDVEKDGGAVEEQEGGETGEADAAPLRFQTYKEAVKKFSLQHTDNDMRSFIGSEKRAVWKRMKETELKTQMNLDEMPLAALHKVRFNPNMSSHIWVASGGQSGLVRFHCLRSMTSPHVKTMIDENQAQFNGLHSTQDTSEGDRAETKQL